MTNIAGTSMTYYKFEIYIKAYAGTTVYKYGYQKVIVYLGCFGESRITGSVRPVYLKRLYYLTSTTTNPRTES
jgi:hypothetical protein